MANGLWNSKWLNGVCTRGRRPEANGRESVVRRVGGMGDIGSKKGHVVSRVWVAYGVEGPMIWTTAEI